MVSNSPRPVRHLTSLFGRNRFNRLKDGEVWLSFNLREDWTLLMGNLLKEARQALQKIMDVQDSS